MKTYIKIVSLVPVLIVIFLASGCGLLTSDGTKGDGTKGNGGDTPPPTACGDILIPLLDQNSGNENPCIFLGQTASAPSDVIQTCLVDPSTLTGTRMNPGPGNIEIQHNGAQIAYAKSASGDGPWTLKLNAIDCSTTGACGPWFDRAEYKVIITNDGQANCLDFGELSLNLDLHK